VGAAGGAGGDAARRHAPFVEPRRRLASLSLYKDIESPDGEITDDRLTLRECGIEGGPGMEPPVSPDPR